MVRERSVRWSAFPFCLVPPQRSVIRDAEFCEHARGKPVRVSLASPGKLNDLLPDKLGDLIVRRHGELERDAHSLEGSVHGLNVLGLESESTGSWPNHRGAANGLELGRPHRFSHATPRCRQIHDGHEELKWGTTRVRSDAAATPRRDRASQVLCSVPTAKCGNGHVGDVSD
jgi:hypothetical protein